MAAMEQRGRSEKAAEVGIANGCMGTTALTLYWGDGLLMSVVGRPLVIVGVAFGFPRHLPKQAVFPSFGWISCFVPECYYFRPRPRHRHHNFMSSNLYAQTYRYLLAVLVSLIPLTGCAALSSLQQSDQNEDGSRLRSATNEAGTAEHQERTSEQNGRLEGNARVRTVAVGGSVRAGLPVLAGSAALAATVRNEGENWLGTRYRYGGTTRRGIDCSSFVQQLMRDALDIDLPRTTASQIDLGVAVSRDELLPADLVFFRRRGVRHVGVYLGDGEFIHASSTRGVTISNLTEGYYERHFWQARRVVDNPQGFVSDAEVMQVSDPSDLLRPGSRRSQNRTPASSQTRRGNPRASW